MKTLVVFYSRTGNTRKVAQELAKKLNADLDEIKDTTDRSGAMGYLIAGRDAMFGAKAEIGKAEKDASKYDFPIIGTPIWSFGLAPAVRTYVIENSGKFKDVAFFCTCGGSGSERAFAEMEKLCGKKPRATVAITESELGSGKYLEKIAEFAKKLG